MITPKEAEKRTREIVAEYISECGCENPDHIRQVLIKLISMAAHAIVATNGLEQATNVLHSTSDYLQKLPPLYRTEMTEDGQIKIMGVPRH
ncbi:TPA: hypothetical protein OT801_003176 [Morganella morganii]|uniref:hypothetical protein n=1 Tax=Enterobacterales TaxID=91347 RepID=UPI000662B294|nr:MULTISPECIES: hypothetical protein [Enterobacterales]EGK5825832.1 hypothetical protein [Salmonella enterica]EJU5899856.1 hypothetical protein [Escherichia coli]HEM8846534.1 hypothetical protein [Proteus mirabilis]EFV8928690.1 hypothetical protein [Shigella sonnei]EFZ1143733.1 hypothetical protein [Shigella sonnei]